MQHHLAPEIVADLDVFLVFMGCLIDRVVSFGSKKKWPICRLVIETIQAISAAIAGSQNITIYAHKKLVALSKCSDWFTRL